MIRRIEVHRRAGPYDRLLDEMAGSADQLSAALQAAQAQIKTDTAHAVGLEKDLNAAKKKLDALQRSIRVAATRTVGAPATTSTAHASVRPVEAAHPEGDDD